MDFKFPDVGEGITEGKLVRWHVKEGDAIKSEQTVASIETDKAVVEIPSPTSGVVEKLFFKPNDTVYVGKPLMTINESGTPSVKPEPTPQPVQKQEPAPQPIVQQPVQTYQNIQPQTVERRFQNVSSQSVGTLAMPSVRKYAKDNGIDLSTIRGTGAHGQILLSDIQGVSGTTQTRQAFTITRPVAQSTNQSSQPQGPVQGYNDILATLATKVLARQMGVDLTKVKGTGANGMITRDDVLGYGKSQAPVTTPTSVSRPMVTGSGSEAVPMSTIRQTISRRMSESIHSSAQYSVMDDVDVTDLVKTREKYKESYEKQGIKLTYLPFIVKAVVNALIKHPVVNSNVDDANKQIILKHYYNIGIATDTPEGLIVPVIKGADSKNIITLAQEIADKAMRAKDRKLRLDEMNDGTFTITNLGNSFGQGFTPIINYPEVAILGVGRIVEKPAIINGQVVPRKFMTLSLTADHRIIDGAEASRFMNDVKMYLEDLNLLLMELN